MSPKTTKNPVFPQMPTLGTPARVVNSFPRAISLCASKACAELHSLIQELSTSPCFVSSFETDGLGPPADAARIGVRATTAPRRSNAATVRAGRAHGAAGGPDADRRRRAPSDLTAQSGLRARRGMARRTPGIDPNAARPGRQASNVRGRGEWRPPRVPAGPRGLVAACPARRPAWPQRATGIGPRARAGPRARRYRRRPFPGCAPFARPAYGRRWRVNDAAGGGFAAGGPCRERGAGR